MSLKLLFWCSFKCKGRNVCVCSFLDDDNNPQTLLFSATCPPWVYEVAKKYMRPGCKHVDLIGKKTQKAATTVEVSVYV